MRKTTAILFCLICAGLMSAQNVSTVDTTGQDLRNRHIYERIYNAVSPVAELPMPELVVNIAQQLLGTPYTWASLESEPEQLHVFLDQTDCILFVELTTCFALTVKGLRIVQAGDGVRFSVRLTPSVVPATPSYELLCENIRQMRYRLGVVQTYASRIHYTSEWILQNQTNGLLYDYTASVGQEYSQPFFYMSAHPDTYFQLRNDSVELAKIKAMEQHLTAQKPYFYVPQSSLRHEEVIRTIHTGDIVAFISPRSGLDLAHVAIAYEVDGQMHFIHASYKAKKVIIESRTLADYAANGIRVCRFSPAL